MYSVYRLNGNELDDRFLAALKTLFQDKMIEIVVTEIDETDYLLKSEANKARLLKAIANVNNGENLIEVPIDSLQ